MTASGSNTARFDSAAGRCVKERFGVPRISSTEPGAASRVLRDVGPDMQAVRVAADVRWPFGEWRPRHRRREDAVYRACGRPLRASALPPKIGDSGDEYPPEPQPPSASHQRRRGAFFCVQGQEGGARDDSRWSFLIRDFLYVSNPLEHNREAGRSEPSEWEGSIPPRATGAGPFLV
jgi:hypothetical protein